MKIAIITRYPWGLFWGGAEVQAQQYINSVKKNSTHEISLIDTYDTSKKYDIYHFIGIGYSTSVMIKRVKSFGAKAFVSPVFYVPPKNEAILKLRELFKIQRGPVAKLYGEALRSADLIMPNSDSEAAQLRRIWGLKRSRIEILPNGYDSEIFNKRNTHTTKNNFGNYLLSVSMIEERKNTLNMIRAFNSSNTKLNLVLAGELRSSNTNFTNEFKQLLNQGKSKIHHLGLVKDQRELASLYAGATAHILPSTLETPGISNLEAAALGTPIIVGDCAPVRDYFNESANFVNGKSISSIRKTIESIHSGSLKHPIQSEIEKYTWSSIGIKLEALYRGEI